MAINRRGLPPPPDAAYWKLARPVGRYIQAASQDRSLNQNSYWWAAVIPPWLEYLREQYGDPTITKEQAHVALKTILMGTKDKALPSGQVVEIVPDTHDLDQIAFSQLIEQAAQWLGEFCEIAVIPSEAFFEERNDRLRKVG